MQELRRCLHSGPTHLRFPWERPRVSHLPGLPPAYTQTTAKHQVTSLHQQTAGVACKGHPPRFQRSRHNRSHYLHRTGLYASPHLPPSQPRDLLDSLKSRPRTCILGYFNAHHNPWRHKTNSRGREVHDWGILRPSSTSPAQDNHMEERGKRVHPRPHVHQQRGPLPASTRQSHLPSLRPLHTGSGGSSPTPQLPCLHGHQL